MIYQNVRTWKSISLCASAWGCFLPVLCGAGIESREWGSGMHFLVTVPCLYLRSWDMRCLWLQHVGKQVVFCSLTSAGFLYLKSIAGSVVLSSWASWSHIAAETVWLWWSGVVALVYSLFSNVDNQPKQLSLLVNGESNSEGRKVNWFIVKAIMLPTWRVF